jgi:hypothetical protein
MTLQPPEYIVSEWQLQDWLSGKPMSKYERRKMYESIHSHPYQSKRDKVLELLTELEWSGLHSDYEDSWGVMTVACPSCFNEKRDGHKESCKLNAILRQTGEP